MTLDELRTKVAEQRTVIASAVTLIQGLHAKLDEAIKSNDPAAIQAVADELKSNTDPLAAAVQENTPAPAPQPAPTPEPTPAPSTDGSTPSTP